MKRIYCAANLPEAHLLLYCLQEENIAARIFNENAQAGVGELPFTHAYPEVWIERREDEAQARSIVQEFEARSTSNQDKTCGQCGERSPSTFETCWRCAALLSTGD